MRYVAAYDGSDSQTITATHFLFKHMINEAGIPFI